MSAYCEHGELNLLCGRPHQVPAEQEHDDWNARPYTGPCECADCRRLIIQAQTVSEL